MSSTVSKALLLLSFFSQSQPELGLSELARLSKIDKATVHRMLGTLVKSGLLEQDQTTKQYRLGVGILRLARIREASFPISKVLENALHNLTKETKETSHASLISGDILSTVNFQLGSRIIHVTMEAGEVLAFHGTASGLAALAFSEDKFKKQVLNKPLNARTSYTVTDLDSIEDYLKTVKSQGFAESNQTHEEDVYGIAAPIFDANEQVIGTLAIATPSHRMSEELRKKNIKTLILETVKANQELGGAMPKSFLQAIDQLDIYND